jgi:hypothetical protein
MPERALSAGARAARAAELLNEADTTRCARGCALPHCGTDAPPAHPYLGGAAYLAPH